MFFIDENLKQYSKKKVVIDNENPSKLKKLKKFFKKYGKFFILGISLVIITLITLSVIDKVEYLKYLKNHEHIYSDGKCEICDELEVYYMEFVDGDGVIIEVPYTIETKKIEQPVASSKIGYNSSWEEKENEDGTIYYEVVYTPIEYKITYHISLEGVENNPLNKTSYNIESSKTSLASLTATGYTFGGWYENSDYTKAVTEIDPSKLSNIDLYAKFIPNKTTIVLYPNGAKESSIRLYVNANESISLKNEYFTKYGYTFTGWSETGANESLIEDGYTFTAGTDEVIVAFYAMWKENETVIIYKSNDESVEDIKQTIKSSETITLINANFKKYASTLVGYSLTENGSIDYAIGSEYRAKEYSETIILYPVFVKNQNKIIFNANGKSSTVMEDIYVDSLSTINLPKNELERIESDVTVFVGWSISPNGSIYYLDESEYTATEYEETITLYAIWTQNSEITIHLDKNGGESSIELDDIVCELNETVDIPSSGLTKSGKTFIGWSLSSDGDLMYAKTYSYNQKIIGGEITLYAVYDTNKTIIKFDANGADGIMPDMTIMAGKQSTLSTNLFTKEGYTFKGWTLNKENNVINYYNSTPYTAELDSNIITLYAVFERNKTIINFNNNGGYGLISSMTVESLDTVLLPSSGFSIDEMNFTGYSLTPGGELVYTVGGEFTATIENITITLYAVYEKNYNLLIFNSNNGKDETTTLKVYCDEKKNLTKNTFTKEFYTFIGWSYAIDGEVIFTDEELYTPTLLLENINLYAQYRINVTEIKFSYNDSFFQMESINIEANEEINLPSNEYVKVGYTFIGWTDSEINDEVIYSNNDKIVGLKDDGTITLYPLFTRNHSTISFDANGGKGTVESLYVESITDFALPMNLFTYAGHKFIGWSLSSDGEVLLNEGTIQTTIDTDDTVVYYAIWENNLRQLKLYYNNGTEDYEIIENFNVSSGDTITLVPTYNDYVFLGWNTDKDVDTALYTSNKKFIIEPMNEYVLYAIYGEMKGTSGLVYKLSSDGTYYSITGYMGIETSVTIPTTLDDIRVKYISDYAFKDNTTIIDITLPKYCLTIGEYAFYNCTNLVDVTLNDNLLTIGEYAFKNTKLNEITIPSSVTEIENGAFMDSSLTSITLNETLTVINESTFENCTSLETINLNNIKTINNKAFYNCLKLDNVNLTEIIKIGNQAFTQNKELKNLTLGEKLEEIGIYAFKDTVKLSTINLPISVKKINNGAFKNSNISNVTLNENIELLGSEAFMGSNLKTATILSTKISYINKDTFKNSALESITLSSSIKKIFNGAFSGCTELYDINLDSVEDIYENAFKDCVSLNEDIYLYNIKNIKDNAFLNTTNLISLLIGSSIETISASAFDNSSLTLIYLNSTSDTSYLSKVGLGRITVSSNPYVLIFDDGIIETDDSKYYWYFDEFNKPVYSYNITIKFHGGILTDNAIYTVNETIPSNFTLTSINNMTDSTYSFLVNDYTFIGWAKEEDGDVIYLDNETIFLRISKKVLDLYAIYQLSTLDSYYTFSEVIEDETVIGYSLTGIVNKEYIKSVSSITIPKYHNYKKVIEIGTAVFKDYTTLNEVVLPDSIKTIKNQAFYNTNLTSINLFSNIEEIEESAFEYCKELISANIEAKYIGKNAFSGDIKLESITLTNTIEIGEAAFKTCVKLANFILPDTLLSIGKEAFSGDESIIKVSMPLNLVSIGDYAFNGATNLASVTLNDGLESIGTYAFSATKVSRIVIPESCVSVGDYAFNDSNLKIIRLENNLNNSTSLAFGGIETIDQLFIDKDISYIENKFGTATVKELYYDNSNYLEFVILGFNPVKTYWYKENAPEAISSNDDKYFKYDELSSPVIYRLSTITVNYHYGDNVDTIDQATMDKYISLINITNLNLGYDTQNPYEEFIGWGYDNIDMVFDKNERIEPTSLSLDLYAVTGYLDQDYKVEPIYENEKIVAYKLLEYTGDNTDLIFPDYIKDTDYSNLYIKVTKINSSKSTKLLNNNVQSIKFNKFITEIPDYAFYFDSKFNNLNRIELTDIITTIGKEAFYNVKIDSINLDKITTLKEKSFNNVEINTNISLINIENYENNSFNNVVLTISNFTISTLDYIKELNVLRYVNNITLTSDVTDIPSATFYKWYSLKTITGLGVKTIGSNAFRNCESLEYAYFDNVETIDEYAFYNSKNLKEIVFKGYINNIGSYAFYNCDNLKKVVIDARNSSSITINSYAFGGITEITDLVTSGNYHTLNRTGFEATNIKNIYLLDDTISEIKEIGFENNDDGSISTIYELYSTKPTTNIQAWDGDYDNISPYEISSLVITYDLDAELGYIFNDSAIIDDDGYYYFTVQTSIDRTRPGYNLVGWSKSSDNSHRVIDYTFGSVIKVHPNDTNLTLYPVYAPSDNNGAIISVVNDNGIEYAKVTGFTDDNSGNYIIPNYTSTGIPITKVEHGTFENITEEFDLTLNDFIIEIGEHAFDNSKIRNLYNTDNIVKVGAYSFYRTNYLNSINFKKVDYIADGAFNTAMKADTTLTFETPIKTFESMDFYNCSATISLTTGFTGNIKQVDELLNHTNIGELIIGEEYEIEELDLHAVTSIDKLIIKSPYVKKFEDQTLTTSVNSIVLGKNMTISANMYIGSTNNTISMDNKVTIYYTEDRQQYKDHAGLDTNNSIFRFMSDEENVNSKYDIYDSSYNKRTPDWKYKYCVDVWTYNPYLTVNVIGDSHRVLTYGEAHGDVNASSSSFVCWNYPALSTDYDSQRNKLNSVYCQFIPNTYINSSIIRTALGVTNNYSTFEKPFNNKEIILNEQQGSYPVTYTTKLNDDETGLIITNITDLKVKALVIPNYLYSSAKGTYLPVVGIETNGLSLDIYGLYIPETVTSISNNAFSNCTSLKRVSIDAPLTSIPAGVFMNSPITEFYMRYPEKVTTINNSSFRNAINIDLSMFTNLSYIGFEAFTKLEYKDEIILGNMSSYSNFRYAPIEQITFTGKISESIILQCTNLKKVVVKSTADLQGNYFGAIGCVNFYFEKDMSLEGNKIFDAGTITNLYLEELSTALNTSLVFSSSTSITNIYYKGTLDDMLVKINTEASIFNNTTFYYLDDGVFIKYVKPEVYKVTFVDVNDEVLYTELVNSGSKVVYPYEQPFYYDDTYVYQFIGWSESLNNINKDLTIKPITIKLTRSENGEYPTSLVTDTTIISELDKITVTDENGYKTYDGEKYLAYDGGSYTDDNGNLVSSGVHYYKVEPIRWKFLSKTTSTETNEVTEIFVVTEYIIDFKPYNTDNSATRTDYEGNTNSETIYLNNYQYSTIRTWLNTDFINTAFDSSSHIKVTEVDNGDTTTNDKVFLLDTDTLYNTDYFYDTSALKARYATTTEYARAAYAKANITGLYDCYMTRTAYEEAQNQAYHIAKEGNTVIFYNVGYSKGVRPALSFIINNAD